MTRKNRIAFGLLVVAALSTVLATVAPREARADGWRHWRRWARTYGPAPVAHVHGDCCYQVQVVSDGGGSYQWVTRQVFVPGRYDYQVRYYTDRCTGYTYSYTVPCWVPGHYETQTVQEWVPGCVRTVRILTCGR